MIISEEDYEHHLEHWGVKGMQWGVRKDHRTEGQRAVDQLNKNAAMMNPRLKKSVKRVTKQNNRNRQNVQDARAHNRARITSDVVGFGTAFVTANLITRKTGNVLLGVVGGTAAGIAGSKFVKQALDNDRKKTALALHK